MPIVKSRKFLYLMIYLLILASSCTLSRLEAKPSVDIVVNENSTKITKFAVAELSSYLSKLYPSYDFPVLHKAKGNTSIFVTVDKNAEDLPKSEEGYLVKSQGDNAYILSKSDAGLIYGVYGLLEKLGCGFYISEQTFPAVRKTFSFDEWDLKDEPLMKNRYVFNWHNFLSGCTGWDTKHWLEWVDRSQKMGYNSLMVHAYFSNPMHTYSFKGIEKPNGGYMTSAIGRGWSNIPVNDVRRLDGGEIFDSAEFGCEVAKADFSPDAKALQDVKAIQKMMSQTFSYAVNRGMDVCFAFDMDISMQNLQKVFISQIPDKDKFAVRGGSTFIPKPWTDEGKAYYQSQMKGLLSSYPMLTQIACWRRGGSWFNSVAPEELPAEWKKQYDDYLANNEVLGTINKKEIMPCFISSRLVLAYQQALKDLGRSDIEIVTGTWGTTFVVPTAIFLPDIKLMPIDWNVRFNSSLVKNEKTLASFKEYANGRVIPFIWSHHDDGQYVGRCYKPEEQFYTKLKGADLDGYGVFHWMNRPQDLFFKNLQRQTWAQTVDELVKDTCAKMAKDYWADSELGTYLNDWVTNAPIFGRATQPNMHYRPWKECRFPEGTVANIEKRLEYLNSVDTSGMTSIQKERLEYFKVLETFVMQFVEAQRHLDKAEQFLAEGKLAQARDELNKGNPEQAVKTYAKLSVTSNEDRGEMTYVITLATKWIGDYDSFRQRARILPIAVKLGLTVPEPATVTQGQSNLWYYIDKKGKFWEQLGNEILMKSIRYANVISSSADAPAEDALDGDGNTRWASRGSQWIQMDIGRIKAVDTVSIDFYKGHIRSYNLNIQISTDGKKWQTVFDGSSPLGSGKQKFAFEQVEARYVRINGNGNSLNEYNAYSEIYIHTQDLSNIAATADANISSAGSVNERGSKYAIVKRKATGKETFIEDIFLEGIKLSRATIRIRPIMRGAGVKNSSHVTKGKYLLKAFASSQKGGSLSLEAGGTSKTFTVKGDEILELDLELKENALVQANASVIDGDIVLCGLILEPISQGN